MAKAGERATGRPGWTVDSAGRLRRETIPHMGRRLPGWDYRRKGHYVITIVLADRREGKLGELKVRRPSACADGARGTAVAADGAWGTAVAADGARGTAIAADGAGGEWLSVAEAKALGLRPDEIEAKVEFSALGRAILDHFRRMGEFTRGLRPVFCAIMPDHLHFIVEVVEELERPLGNAIGGFKTGCEKIYAKTGGKGRLFAEGFVDEICLRAGQLACEFDYLNDNPRRLAIKRLYPWLFKVTRELRVDFRLAPKGQAGQPAATKGQAGQAATPTGPGERGARFSPAPAAPAAGLFSAIGNHFLLARPTFHQVQVSRRFFAYRRDARGNLAKDEPPAVATPEFAEKLAAALSAAKSGAVVISPCVSQGEREIARQVFAAGGRVVTLQNKGFSPLYKPGGRLFETCAAGNLLMLAPAAWPYQPAEKPMTRTDAQVLNRLAQLIAGDGAAEIDYKGAVVADIDALARAAVKTEGRR